MRKTTKTKVQVKPPERFPIIIQQSPCVVSSILGRIASRELDMSEMTATIGTVPKPAEVQTGTGEFLGGYEQ